MHALAYSVLTLTLNIIHDSELMTAIHAVQKAMTMFVRRKPFDF